MPPVTPRPVFLPALLLVVGALVGGGIVRAQTPAPVAGTNAAGQTPPARTDDNVRPIPPPGIAIPDADRAELSTGVTALGREIESLKSDLKNKPGLSRFLPDVQIFYNAVRYPLAYNEFYNVRDAGTGKSLLQQGMERAAALRAGSAPWTKETGLLVLGYVSRIDESVQPYGLVVPPTWVAGETKRHRLDFFLHGRGETLTELAFLSERRRSPGEFTPPDTFVLHPYGRYCNANRFAGEVDLFEALANAKTRYPIDDDRIVVRGFSMGGASAWQYATHHADKWAAAAPGAGFSETAEFLRIFGPGKTPPPWYEQKLWHWYDSVDYAANLYQCPVVAYNGDRDGQKQAADRMQDAMAKEGLPLTRVVGPDTGHAYHPDSKKEINARLDGFAAQGRDTLPRKINFTTWTLRYNTMAWLTVTGLEQHWERARVSAERTDAGVVLQTQNVSRFTLSPRAAAGKAVVIDGQRLAGLRFVKTPAGRWAPDKSRDDRSGLRKTPGLQGPIDDAFLDRFVMVRPTGAPLNAAVGAWAGAEMTRAVREWRAQFRGEAPVKDDKNITSADITTGNLVLWGDPFSNAVLARIASRLPVRWDKNGAVHVGAKTYAAGTSVPILIYPNPLNPRRYVVLNSGITWREGHYDNNAKQYSHLPDWAIVDITTPPDKFAPGRIADAGFFDEHWQITPGQGRP